MNTQSYYMASREERCAALKKFLQFIPPHHLEKVSFGTHPRFGYHSIEMLKKEGKKLDTLKKQEKQFFFRLNIFVRFPEVAILWLKSNLTEWSFGLLLDIMSQTSTDHSGTQWVISESENVRIVPQQSFQPPNPEWSIFSGVVQEMDIRAFLNFWKFKLKIGNNLFKNTPDLVRTPYVTSTVSQSVRPSVRQGSHESPWDGWIIYFKSVVAKIYIQFTLDNYASAFKLILILSRIELK